MRIRASLFIVTFGLVLLLASCASSGPDSVSEGAVQERRIDIDAQGESLILRTTEELSVHVDTVDVAVDRLWAAMPVVYDSLGIGLTTINAAARVMGAQNVRVRGDLGGTRISQLFRCGVRVTGQIADQYDVHVTSLTQVEEAVDGRTVVSTHARAYALPGGYTSNAIRCSSRGELESRILNRLLWETSGAGGP